MALYRAAEHAAQQPVSLHFKEQTGMPRVDPLTEKTIGTTPADAAREGTGSGSYPSPDRFAALPPLRIGEDLLPIGAAIDGRADHLYNPAPQHRREE
jgi:hypothetical protein